MEKVKKLFAAVNSNDHKKLKFILQDRDARAAINAKNAKNVTILHIAAWKGHMESVRVILQNKGDPNIVGMGGSTPLHYAAKFGHYAVVLELLSNGAIYDVKTEKGKRPLDLCNNPPIRDLLMNVAHLFLSTAKRDPTPLIGDLNKIKDMSVAKAVVNARNEQNKTLIETAFIAGNLRMDDTPGILREEGVFDLYEAIITNQSQQKVKEAAQSTLKSRIQLFGPESPVTLTCEKYIYMSLCTEHKYNEALLHYERLYEIEKRTLGENCRETITTNGFRAGILEELGRYWEALPILENVVEKQLSGDYKNEPEFSANLDTLGMVYMKLGIYDKALVALQRAYDMYKEKHGPRDDETLSLFTKVALAYSKQTKHSEARKIYREVFLIWLEDRGLGNYETLRMLYNIAESYGREGNTIEGERLLKEVLENQLKYLGNDHSDTATTQYLLADFLKCNGKTAESKELLSSIEGKSNFACSCTKNHTKL